MDFDKETSEAMTRLAEKAAEKIENAFIDSFLKKEGETIEDVKTRLAEEQKAREEKMYRPASKNPLQKHKEEN